MSPRGTSIGARTSTRKSFAFFWAALFIVSIALQYAQLSKPSPVDAASGLLADTVAGFEIDGNLKGNDASTNPAGITPASLINNPPMANGADWLDPNGVASASGTSTADTFLFEDAVDPGDISAYAGGNKEDDTTDWKYINSAGPNAKTDFRHIMAHAKVVGNSAIAYMGAERNDPDPSGTMVVDFELNRKPFKVYPLPAGNNVPKPDRTAGDLLISLEYSNGGGNPIITIYRVANVVDLQNGQTNDFVKVNDADTLDAVRSATNFVDLTNSGFGYTVPAFDFAEASIDLSKIGITSACPGFSTGHMRSRTGGSPSTSQLKDTARNFDIDLNNCGTVTIIKNAVPNDPQDFSFTGAGGVPVTGAFKLDNDGDETNTLKRIKTIELVPPGNYTVTETPVDRWSLTNLECVDDKVQNSTGNKDTGVASINVQANENVTCTFTNTKQKNNPTIVTTADQTGVVVGGNISDSATLSGGFSPTGTIIFRAYGPNNPTCAGNPAFESNPVTVNGNATYGPVTYATQGVGTYLWRASYSGDDENNPASGACGDPGETDTTIKDSPTISTVASANITIGGTISDTATLADGFNPTGTITYSLYGPNNSTCTGVAIFTTTKTVNGNGSYTSATFTPVATGTYRWIASYGGDANNNAVSGACNDANESVVVGPATPGISTSAAEPAVVIGNAVSDTAVLTGAVNPTGSITFNLYGPNDATCTGVVAYTTSLPVTANGSFGPVSFTPTAIGTYRWIASYSGDGNNSPITGLCNDAGENDTVIKASPAIVTSANESVVVGNAVHDTATLSGGVTPTGTITFTAYSDAQCLVSVYTTSLPVINGNASYGPVQFVPLTTGVYHWIASYGGDAKNNPIAGACSADGENDTVTPAVPAISTSANETSVVIGGDVHDTASLTGGVNPTGTITFTAYSDAQCQTSVFSTSLPVDHGNGSYGPVGFTPAAVGTYHWIASYGGDVNNGPIAGACGADGENDTVIPASPAIVTSADESAVVIGGSVSDSATLSGGVSPTGTITFKLYSTADCSGAAVFTSTPIAVTGNATYGPVSFAPTAVGTYHWIASYSGDAKNNPIAGTCGDAGENDTVIPASPTIATVATDGGVAGDQISDTATLTGAHLPTTGTVTFNLYGRLDPTCQGTPIFTSTVAIGADGTASSAPFTATQAGNYQWIASYSGDANNDPVAGTCGDENESTSIRAFNPEITTSLTSGQLNAPKITVLFGATVTDQATLTGHSATAGGSVTYTVYSDAECSTMYADAGTKTVTNGIVPASDPVTFPDAGTYYWQAVYSGDINNATDTSDCADEVLTVTTPDINVLKLVKTNNGTFAPTSTANPGDVLTFQITVSNTGDGDATNIPVSDDIAPVLAHATYNDDCSNSCSLVGTVLGWTINVPSGSPVILTFSVTLDDVFPLGTTELPNVVVVTGPGSNCPAASEDADCDTNTTVLTPDINVLKLVKTNNGTFAPTSTAKPGDKLTFQITVSNTGDGPAKDIPVSDDIKPVLAHAAYNGDCSNSCVNTAGVLSWTIDIPADGQVVLTFSVTLSNTFPLGTTTLPNVVVVTGPGSNCPAPSEVAAAAIDPDCDTTTTVSVSSLLIDKTNDAPLKHIELPPPAAAVDLPTAPEGSTVTFTLNYTFGGDPETNGIITDVLPVGLTYVEGSATNSAEFTFVPPFNATTRTLTWTAANVTASGTVTYQAKVDIGAAALKQPLTNVATIDSDQTVPDSDTSDVYVPVPPKVETGPPTDIEAPATTGTPGNSLPLILAILAAVFFTVAFVTPVPATARRRNRQR